MTNEFGKSGDPGTQEFSLDATTDTVVTPADSTITPDELAELRKRDVNAQQHIPRLQEENEQLRLSLTEAEQKLEGSATMQDVLNRIKTTSDEAPVAIDADAVAQQVEQRLNAKATEATHDKNWEAVMGQLKTTHGSLENVDTHVSSRAAELGMDLSEATMLAKRSPDAFMKLYASEGSPVPQQGTASAAGQQTSIDTPHGEVHDKAYYDKMLRENPKKYWKVDTQAALRRDVYGWGT